MNKKKKVIYIGVLSAFIAVSAFVSFPTKAIAAAADELYLNTYSSIKTAMTNKTQKSINNARTAIASLSGTGASWAIGEFSHQIDLIQQPILVKIVTSITTAQNNPTQANVNSAKAAIDPDLIDVWRNSYNSAVDKIEQGIINNAVDAFNTAKLSNSPNDISIAWNKINEIKTSTDNNVMNWANDFAEQIIELAKNNNVKLSTITEPLTVTEIAKNANSVVLVEARDINNNVVATGSGFIISSNGKVITNYHVIDGAYYVDVIFQNGTKYEVDGVLGNSISKDIVIMQLKDASNLQSVLLGDSDTLQLGNSIVAIGSPLGIQNTISTGIVSGLNRVNNREGKDIQISAPINDGSSGGALFNMNGQVVGITYSGINTTGDLNFAIPINDVKPFMSIEALTKLSQLAEINKPKIPTEVSAKAVSSSEIQIQWNKVEGVDYYYVYASADNGVTYIPFRNDDGSKMQLEWYSDYSAIFYAFKENYTYYFKVTSVRNGIESDYSNMANVTTLVTQRYFPSLSDVPQPYGINYKISSTLDGKIVYYQYKISDLPDNFNSSYTAQLIANGWTYFGTGTDAYGRPTIKYRKGDQVITTYYADRYETILIIMGTVH